MKKNIFDIPVVRNNDAVAWCVTGVGVILMVLIYFL
jgi:hypothetical protein